MCFCIFACMSDLCMDADPSKGCKTYIGMSIMHVVAQEALTTSYNDKYYNSDGFKKNGLFPLNLDSEITQLASCEHRGNLGSQEYA